MYECFDPFQIDGNFGGAAGIGEMVLQSHEGFISLLPALPEELSCGSFTGLRARGGFTVDAVWENGAVVSFSAASAEGKPVDVELPAEDGTVYADADGRTYAVSGGKIALDGNASLTLVR